MKRLFCIGYCLLIGLPIFFGQSLESYVDQKTLGLNDILHFTVKIKGQGLTVNPEFPEVDGFTKGKSYKRPSFQGNDRETLFIQYYFPKKTGTFSIPSFPITLPDGIVYTQSHSITITASSAPTRGAPSFSATNLTASLSFEPSKTDGYEGEQIAVSAFLFVRYRDRNNFQLLHSSIKALENRIEFTGFWEERREYKEVQPQIIKKNGVSFLKIPIFQTFIYPIQSGKLNVPGIFLNIGKKEINYGASFYERQQGTHTRYTTEQIEAEGFSLNVKELPSTHLPRAKSVGEFQMTADISDKTIPTGSSIPLTLTIYGNGNIRSIPRPNFNIQESFLHFDPISSHTVSTSDSIATGQKDFVYELIPAIPGEYVLGPAVFYYFDPVLEKYDSVRIDRIPLSVTGKTIPQLLEVNALDGFYRNAFARASNQPPFSIPYTDIALVVLTGLAGVLLLVAGFRKA